MAVEGGGIYPMTRKIVVQARRFDSFPISPRNADGVSASRSLSRMRRVMMLTAAEERGWPIADGSLLALQGQKRSARSARKASLARIICAASLESRSDRSGDFEGSDIAVLYRK
jgi:hypothetical protein